MAHGMTPRPAVTAVGRRSWERIVRLAAAPSYDRQARTELADALAALVAEVTPSHREVLASSYHRWGAIGRFHTWPLPPSVTGGVGECERWASTVLLDCVDRAIDTLAAGHTSEERSQWRAAAQAYTAEAQRRSPAGDAGQPLPPDVALPKTSNPEEESPFGPLDQL